MNRRTSVVWPSIVGAAVVASLGIVGCSTDETPSSTDNCAAKIDRFKELAIVDDAVIGDPRTLNSTGGPWSFRHAVEQMVPQGMTSSDFVTRWVTAWSSSTRVNASSVAPRPLVGSKLVCPWLRSTPANECNDDCTTCTQRQFDLGKAPFRLLAIVNRMDLRKLTPDAAGTGESGEGRLIFGMTSGPADDPASVPLAMTTIFEFELVGPAKEWAEKWHSLGAFEQFDESYKVALEGVTNGFVRALANPDGHPESSISQVRTNEREFDWQWQLREFKLGPDGLFLAPLKNTPDPSLNDSETLRKYLVANRALLLTERFDLPVSLRGATITQGFRWAATGVDEPLRKAFALQTCNGCHQTEATAVDVNFHVSPFKSGIEKLSLFMNDPADPDHDDLGARTASIREVLCAQ